MERNKVKFAINGFGRIGRAVARAWWENYRESSELVAVNTSGSMEVEDWAHLLKYDSVYGRFPALIHINEPEKGNEIGRVDIGGKKIPFLAERQPKNIPWQNYQVDVVLECTGVFRDRRAEDHFKGKAKKVIISAPSKDVPIYLLGVNAEEYRGENLIEMGSCTTNCVAPIVKLIDRNFGFEECIMTTIHALTSSQNIVDGSHKDLRRARAGSENIVPTGTGAAKSVINAYPEVKGRFAASAIRVPVLCGSYSDLIFKTHRKTTIDEVNKVLETAAAGELVEIMKVSYEPLVSRDIIGNTGSAIVDLPMTEVLSDDMIKISAWYDNEYGYSCRLIEMAEYVMTSS
jgi:glyceraldehyde 3-phosphate dehydrogenase